MAYVNLKTGKIYGAEKGTLKYYHEEGHIKFDSTEAGQNVRTLQDVSLDGLIMVSALYIIYPTTFLRMLVLLFALSKIASNLAEEIKCWIYAKRKLNEVIHDRRDKKKKQPI